MSERVHIIVEEEGKRLDLFLSERLSITRTRAKRLIEEGRVLISKGKPKPSLIVKKGMEITCEIPPKESQIYIAERIPLNILYEDEYLIAVNKPQGMVVHPSFGHKKGTLLNAFLYHIGMEEVENPRVGIVHRLDKDTTGVILLAKDERTQSIISSLFKKREIKKGYRAIVHGIIKEKDGIIETYIGRDPKDRKKMKVLEKDGKYAKTVFKVLKHLRDFSYLEIYPETGRTHQIRVHLSYIGHPVVGDRTYGKKDRIERPFLHAYSLSFLHPVTGMFLDIKAPLPEDMLNFLKDSLPKNEYEN